MAHLTPEHILHLYDTFGELRVLDDIIRHRSKDNPPAPILGYPRVEDNPSDYETFTGQQLDSFVDAACKYFIKNGLKPVSELNIHSRLIETILTLISGREKSDWTILSI